MHRTCIAFFAFIFCTTLAITADVDDSSSDKVSEPAAVSQNPGLPTLHGYAQTRGFHLYNPLDNDLLSERFIEVITVVDVVDLPFHEGDDRIQNINPEYNSPEFNDMVQRNPGTIAATFTIFAEEKNTEDNKVQVWESIIIRVYNKINKDEATHYCDSSLWKTQPGFYSLTSDFLTFSNWKIIDQKLKLQE